MDKIIIKDLEVYAFHGVHSEEKKLGQMFIVSVDIFTDLKQAAQTDDLLNTIHYGYVCKDIERVMSSFDYNLIETVAYKIIETLMEKYPTINSIKASVKKPWAPLGKHLKYVAIEIERTREEMYASQK